MYVDWTCININRKDVHARMISIKEIESDLSIKIIMA